MDAVPSPVPVPAAAPQPPPAVLTAWPRSAQLTTAFLLGVAVTLLGIQVAGLLRWGSRPTDLERSTTPAYRIDLNRAERAELLQLPGVGPALVERIEAYRRERGGFRSVDELTEVHGIGPTIAARLRPWVCVQPEQMALSPHVERSPAVRKTKTITGTSTTGTAKPPGKKEASLTEAIDINRASAAELQRLPGIGPKMSQRIIDERAKGAFKAVDELRGRVSGIGVKTLERLRPYIRVGEEPAAVAAVE
jgi:competence protein ComEA